MWAVVRFVCVSLALGSAKVRLFLQFPKLLAIWRSAEEVSAHAHKHKLRM